MSDHRKQTNQNRAGRSTDFQAAVEKLEEAVQEIVRSAKGQFSDRATQFIDETTSRIKTELGGTGAEDSLYEDPPYEDPPYEDPTYEDPTYEDEVDSQSDAAHDRSSSSRRSHRSRSRRRAYRDYGRYGDSAMWSGRYASSRPRTQQLYRDPKNEKIAGVCSGLANYFGIEAWVVRCGAITGLLFLPGIVFPAYWVMYFIMSNPPKEGEPAKETKRERRRREKNAASGGGSEKAAPQEPVSPRRSLRGAQVVLTQAELRLRRLETHVTSGRYELQKELNKLDDGGGSAPA
ncbi:MAG: PspC domain-containing protein [Proteobacteria bacterium]|nr:PspC domain-containing protein [Pseudomonadota bacterium]